MEQLIPALTTVLAPGTMAVMALGLIIGIVIGAVPGLNVPLAVAIALPITFKLDPIGGIAMLVGIYKGGTYGGSLSAVLINVPGTPAAAATAMDGAALTRQGKAGKALKMSLYASIIGEFVSDLALIAFAGPVAMIALEIGPPEAFALGIFALTLIGVLSQGSLVKGLIAGALGLFLSTFGVDPLTGEFRLTFGYRDLSGGWKFIALVIGIFAIAEAINLAYEHRGRKVASGPVRLRDPAHRLTREDWRRTLPVIARAAPIGVFIGAIPGLGAAVSAFLNYGIARNMSRDPSRFGKGALEGVAAAETGNNAVTGSTFIPLLTLGIPGDIITAIMLGAFMVHGLIPGPALFQQRGDFIAAFFVMMVMATALHLVIARAGMSLFIQTVRVPNHVLFPVVAVLSVTGVYIATNRFFDVYVMLGFGVLGFAMIRLAFPVAPLLIGFILGPLVEVALRQSLVLSRGSLAIFIERPVAGGFLALALGTIALVARRHWRDTHRPEKQSEKQIMKDET